MVEKSHKEELNLRHLGGDLSLSFYKDTLEYLGGYLKQTRTNQDLLTKTLMGLLKDEELVKDKLELILNYQIESGKILYATIALMDKLLQLKEDSLNGK